MNKFQLTDEITKKKHLKPNVKYTIYFAVIGIFAILSAFLFLKTLNTKTTHLFYYDEKSNLDYSVCLKENNYYEETCLGKDRQYIANLIDQININFQYGINSSDPFDYTYRYRITAKVIATEKGTPTKIIYEKSENIVEEKEVQKKDIGLLNIKEPISINYQKYNDLMNTFKKDYTLTLDSKIILTMEIQVNGKYKSEKDNITENQKIELTIPLTEQTIDIKMDYKNMTDQKVITVDTKHEIANLIYFILFCVTSLITLATMIKLLFSITRKMRNRTPYVKTLKKILNDYDAIIVESAYPINFEGYTIIEVSRFEELVDAKENLGKPIVFHEIVKNKLSVFVILAESECYRYVLKKERGNREDEH